jgi:hypothetical protein
MIAVGEAGVVLHGVLRFKKGVGCKRRCCGKSWDKVSSGWRCVDDSPFAFKKSELLGTATFLALAIQLNG